jgi:hypothetical protein
MAIKIIDVKQVRGNFYGGFPYRVSWSFGGESEPSKLTVEVVNEKGEYSKPNLSFSNIETINIGKFNFQGYLVSYSKNTQIEQKVLTLEYVDQSILLDKFWVGLHKQHGDKTGNNPPNTIILGKEYHPCDLNMDSNIDYDEKNIRLIDPCDPCPFSPVDKYKEACDPRIEKFEDFETFYTFSELIDKIRINIPELNIQFNASNLYMFKAQHVGDLRSVLSSWASDLGVSFYWDPIGQSLIFKSRSSFSRRPITYEQILNLPGAIEVNYSENILDTYSQGFIGTYERPGGLEKYECRESIWKMLRPLNVDNFFLPETRPLLSQYQGELSPRSVAIALSYYSSALRDAFLWFNYYGIKTGLDAEKYTDSSNGGPDSGGEEPDDEPDDDTSENNNTSYSRQPITSTQGGGGKSSEGGDNFSIQDGSSIVVGNSYQPEVASLDPNIFTYTTKRNDNCGSINNIKSSQKQTGDKTVLKHFGNMIIREVFVENSSVPRSKSIFYRLKAAMPKELKQFYDNLKLPDGSPGFYFFIAEVSEEGYDESVSVDRNLANQVMGKLYFNRFRTIVTGANDDESECEIQTPNEDASGQWFKAKTGSENIKIFNFGHEEGSFVDNLKTNFKKDIEENKRTDEKRSQKQGLEKLPEDYVANSFILVDRNGPKWSPEKEFSDKWLGDYYAWWGDRLFKEYKVSNGRPDELFSIFPEAFGNENIKLFIVKELPDGFPVKIKKSTHPLENLGGSKIRIEEDAEGKQIIINEGPWGLLSKDCYEIDIDGRMVIFPPVGAFQKELDNYQDECQTAPSYTLLENELYTPAPPPIDGPGYRTFVECGSIFPKLFKKFKHIMYLPAQNVAKARKINYVPYQLSEQNVAIFGDSCIPDKGRLNEYLRDLGGTSQYNYTDPFFQINFKLADVAPEMWSIEEGLSSINIEVTENGTFTSYTFSTKVIQPPSITFIEQNFRSQKRSAFGNKIGLLTSVKGKTIRH